MLAWDEWVEREAAHAPTRRDAEYCVLFKVAAACTGRPVEHAPADSLVAMFMEGPPFRGPAVPGHLGPQYGGPGEEGAPRRAPAAAEGGEEVEHEEDEGAEPAGAPAEAPGAPAPGPVGEAGMQSVGSVFADSGSLL